LKQINRQMEEVIQRLQNDAKDEQASDLTQEDEADEDSKPGTLRRNYFTLRDCSSQRKETDLKSIVCFSNLFLLMIVIFCRR
jgi:hypothetical protein